MNQESRITNLGDGTLSVPDRPVIPFIQGDGIGPDIWHATRMVLDAAVAKVYSDSRGIAWMEVSQEEGSRRPVSGCPMKRLRPLNAMWRPLRGR